MNVLKIPKSSAGVLAWGLIILLAVASAAYAINRISTELLVVDAERTALEYVDFISTSIPSLPGFLETANTDSKMLAELRKVRRLGKVFRFKLFDSKGNLLVVSDDLDKSELVVNKQIADSLGKHQNSKVESVVLGGSNYIEHKDGREIPDRPDVYSAAYVPMISSDGLSGVVEVYVDQTDRAATIKSSFLKVASVIGLLLLLLGCLGVYQAWLRLSDRRRSDSKIRYLAEHDVLCGVFNRTSFEKTIEQSIWRNQQGGPTFSVLCVDLDRFKEINDTLGHSAGDLVLQQVSGRLKKIARDEDTVSRLGGDEFAILLAGTSDTRSVEQLGVEVVKSLAEPFIINDVQVPCGASVGAARFNIDAVSISDLLHKADLAMYRSKTTGRGKFSFYDPELDKTLEKRRVLALELRSAVADGTLSLHYQPLHDSNCELVGYEALMRWNHSEHGMISPVEFIPLAEETGLIDQMGTWAMQQACRDASKWPAPLRVAVNLSAIQFAKEYNLIAVVSDALERAGLAADRLEVEITESLLINNTDEVLSTLTALSEMGVKIAMDDFGTGYSSLSYLWQFPFNKLKIDRAFTQGLEDDAKVPLIVNSIISLAHSMGIRVNAEGVETEQQLSILREAGCDELQGFLLGRPAPVEVLEHLDSKKAA